MTHIHYLRAIASIRKRGLLFANELAQITNAKAALVKRNENSPTDLYLKILNELRTLKMSSVIRYKQQYFSLLPEESELATMLALRTLKEKYFLKKLNAEVKEYGTSLDFNPIVQTLNPDYYPSEPALQVIRENLAVHKMSLDFYKKLDYRLRSVDRFNKLVWLIQSMAAMERRYLRNEHNYRTHNLAS